MQLRLFFSPEHNMPRLSSAVALIGLVVIACVPESRDTPRPQREEAADELPTANDPPDDPPIVSDGPTFSGEIAPLFQQHCQRCHHDGGIAPFELMTYADAAPVAADIKGAVLSGRMPQGIPIRLDTGCSEEDTFEGPRRLTREEIDLIVAWVDAGALEGDAGEMPPPLSFDDAAGWSAGEPDFVFANDAEGFMVPGGLGRDVFRRFVVPTDFAEDRFITGFEALPGAAGGAGLEHVVHHVTLFIDPAAASVAQLEAFQSSSPEVSGPGFEGDFTYPVSLVGMWFPGSRPLEMPPGLGLRVPRGACIVMEVHYGKTDDGPAFDRTFVGLRFADSGVEELQTSLVKTEEIFIAAGERAATIEATRTFSSPFTLYAITPHMHQLGTDFKVMIELPENDDMCLADVAWDFEHQGTYRLRDPLALPAGTVIRNTCVYDNSADNPNQFNDPPQDINFGRVTDKEMCQLTIATTGLAVAPPPPPPPPPVEDGELLINEILADPPSGYDANGDGVAHFQQDEFIEFVNVGGAPLDLSGATISDLVGVRATMPDGLSLAAGEALVVFGGGEPAPMSTARVVAAGPLQLNNDGDEVTIVDSTGTVLATASYGDEGGQNQSLVRAVDEDPSTSFVLHETITTAPASPGLRADGAPL